MELKKSVVKSVNKKDMFNELYKFELTMEDGTTGMMYKKSENPFVKIGDEVVFGVNAKGTIKIIPKGQENTPYTPNKPYVKDTSRDDIIMIQTMIKSSAEYHGRRKDSTINDVMDTAQIWYEFSQSVANQKSTPTPKPVVIERTKVDNNPF